LSVPFLELAVDISTLGLDIRPFKVGRYRAYVVRRLAVDALHFKSAVIDASLMVQTLKTAGDHVLPLFTRSVNHALTARISSILSGCVVFASFNGNRQNPRRKRRHLQTEE
jgi:hypothetical protein